MSERRNRYTIQAVARALTVLRCFDSPRQVLALKDVVQRTGFSKPFCFRALQTLCECGLLQKVAPNAYRRVDEFWRGPRTRIGYASIGDRTSFAREVDRSVALAAERHGVQLISLDNGYDPQRALKNADYLVREQVDLVIEFQTHAAVAPQIAAKYLAARIPFIAVDVPHPGGVYFGADNYNAGRLAGRYLGKWILHYWNGELDQLLLLEIRRAGQLAQMRLQGVIDGLREMLRGRPWPAVMRLDGDGLFGTSLEVVRGYLRNLPSGARVAVAAANDASALGAVRALEEAGRAGECVVTGQNGEPDARLVLRERNTPLICTVAYFPEEYGPALIRLALDILAGRPVPPAAFVRHVLLTPANVDRIYANDPAALATA